jgi:hypothetical protein
MKTPCGLPFSSLSALCTLLITLALSITSCWKEPEQQPIPPSPLINKIIYDSLGLPTHTQIGIGSFGFLLNDTAWLPGCGSLLDPLGTKIYSDGSNLDAKNNCNGDKKSFQMRIPNPTTVGSFPLADPFEPGFDAYYTDYVSKETYMCSLKAFDRSKFIIDFYDPIKRVRSGRFEMTMYRVISPGFPGGVISTRDQYLDLKDSTVIRAGRYDVVGYQ